MEIKEYLGFLCEMGVHEYPRLSGGHTSETVYRVLNESKECVHTIYVMKGESTNEFEDIVLRHKYNLFATIIDEDCFSPLLVEERSWYLYAGSVKDYIGKIDFKKGFIFDKTLSLETKEVLARKLQPMFEKNRGGFSAYKRKRNVKQTWMEIIEIVDKLVGDTQPTWRSERDLEALNALEAKIGLVKHLIKEIKNASSYKDEQAHSVSRIGIVADKFLKELKEEL